MGLIKKLTQKLSTGDNGPPSGGSARGHSASEGVDLPDLEAKTGTGNTAKEVGSSEMQAANFLWTKKAKVLVILG